MEFTLVAAYLTSSYVGSLISEGGPILTKGAPSYGKLGLPGPHLTGRMEPGAPFYR